MSPATTRASEPPAASSFGPLRAVSASLAPRRRNASAQAAPNPSEAPVMSTTLPSIFIGCYPAHRQAAIIVHMQQELLPLFPLEVVLFPRTPLPLHIFEDRYKQMVGEGLENKSEFGVVLAGEKGIVSTGCTASGGKVMNSYPDGRMDILTLGRRRFEIILLNDEKSYLRGAVEFFDDEEFEAIPDDTARRVLEAYTAMREMEHQEPLVDPEMSDPQV